MLKDNPSHEDTNPSTNVGHVGGALVVYMHPKRTEINNPQLSKRVVFATHVTSVTTITRFPAVDLPSQ